MGCEDVDIDIMDFRKQYQMRYGGTVSFVSYDLCNAMCIIQLLLDGSLADSHLCLTLLHFGHTKIIGRVEGI